MGFAPLVSILGMLLLFAAPSNDLLDYLPTQSYWESKHVEVSVQSMAAELADAPGADAASLIDQLSNPDPQLRNDARKKLAQLGRKAIAPLREAQDMGDPQTVNAAKELIAQIITESQPAAVRRLMAIRALGESGDPAAVAVLTPLLKSTELFEADYAATAIATLHHEAWSRPPAAAAECAADAWRFPGDCAVVVQATNYRFHPLSLSALVAQEMIMSNRPRQVVLDEYNSRVLAIAEVLGNVRLQALTIGVAGHVSIDSGYLAIVFRGQFDPLAMGRAIETQMPGMHETTMSGFRVYCPPSSPYMPDFSYVIPDEHRVVMILGPPRVLIDSVVAAVAAGKDDLHGSADLSPLLAAADMTQPLWGVAKVTPSFQAAAPILAPFDTLTLHSGIGQDQMLHVKLSASGNDPVGAKSSATTFNTGVADMLRELRPMLTVMPITRPLLRTLESIHCDADGGNANMTMQGPPSLLQAMLGSGSSAPPATGP